MHDWLPAIDRAVRYVSQNWPVFAFLATAAGFFLARRRYKIPIIQPFEEIAHKQREYRRTEEQEAFRRRMLDRHLQLGNGLLSDYHLKAAREEFEYALGIDPNSVPAQLGLMKARVFEPILKNDYDPDVSVRRIQLILDELPGDKHALLFMGILHLRIGTHDDHEAARDYFRKALVVDDRLVPAWVNLGYMADVEHDPDRAMELYRKAYETSPWNLSALNNLAYHLVRSGNYAEAAHKCRVIIALNPNNLISYWNLSNALRLDGDLAGAEKVLMEANPLFQSDEQWDLGRNNTNWFFQTADDGSGVEFDSVAAKRAYTSYSLAATRLALGDDAGARSVLKSAAATDPDGKAAAFISYQLTLLGRLHSSHANVRTQFERMLSKARPSDT